MDIVTIGGLIFAWACVLVSIVLEGAPLGGFVKGPPALLVFGGTLGATLIGMSKKEIKTLGAKTRKAFSNKEPKYKELIDTLVGFATVSRRDGVLALENSIESINDEFLKKGLQLVVDGVDTDRLRHTLETDMASLKAWYKEGQEFYKQMGGFSPTLGIIGTVLGLIAMLAELENAEAMGPAIASAFIATMYGISAANLVYLPIGNKLKTVETKDLHEKKIILEGLMCIQDGVSPRMVEQTLLSFLYPEVPKGMEQAEVKA